MQYVLLRIAPVFVSFPVVAVCDCALMCMEYGVLGLSLKPPRTPDVLEACARSGMT